MCSGEEYVWLVIVLGGCVWVRMGAYGCIGLGEREKQTGNDTHGQLYMISRPLWPGNFPKYMVGQGVIQKGTQQASDGFRWSQIAIRVSLSDVNKKTNESHINNQTTATDLAAKQRRENNNKKCIESNKQKKNEQLDDKQKGARNKRINAMQMGGGGELFHAKKLWARS